MRKFFAKFETLPDNQITISDKDKLHHLRDVLRIKKGEAVGILDGKGNELVAEAREITPEKILFVIKERKKLVNEGSVKLTVACAIPKQTKMDDIVDKLTQLGVYRIIPMLTDRVIVKLDKSKKDVRCSRWQKIAKAATEQSQRGELPIVDAVRDIEEVLSYANAFDLKLIPTLAGDKKTLQEVIQGVSPRNVLVLIGPEGDFTDEEINLAVKSGCVPVSLGDTVLRVDTAAICVASYLRLAV
jgi:16S rRNA (uracil1498-N3)-methyltransferase